jgi:hypothetical protein
MEKWKEPSVFTDGTKNTLHIAHRLLHNSILNATGKG